MGIRRIQTMSQSDVREHLSIVARRLRPSVYSIVSLACLLAMTPILCRSVATAQTFRGSIVGTVTDVNSAAIPDAIIGVRNVATGLARSSTTDSAGNYAIPELPIGTYEV